MRKWIGTLLAGLALVPAAHGRVNVVATLPDQAAVAEAVGGDAVNVVSLARGTEDAHFVDPKPSFVVKLNRADLLIVGGADLESGWLPPLVNSARNPKILPGGVGRLDAAVGVGLLDVSRRPVDRSQGDVHPGGNPHYMLDPLNAKTVASNIAVKLGELDPGNAARFKENARRFHEEIDRRLEVWKSKMSPLRGAKVLTYHKSFDYFVERFGLVLTGTIEPKPGLEPSPTHIASLVPRMKREGVQLVLMENNRPRKTPAFVAEAIGAPLVEAPLMVGGDRHAADYIGLIDRLVTLVAGAVR